MSAAASDAAARRAKLLRRTRTGATITLGLAGVLYLTTLFRSELPVLAVCALLLAVCVWEVDRMGSLAGRRLWAPLSAGALAALWTALIFSSTVGGGIPQEEILVEDLGESVEWLGPAWMLSTIAVAGVYALACVRSKVVRAAGALLLAAPFFAIGPDPLLAQAEIVTVVLALFVFLRLVVFGAERRGEALALLVLGPLLAVSLVGLAPFLTDYSHRGLVALLAIAKLGDTAGYYVGSTLGRHHPFPSISPGKTTEGCVGSFIAGAAAGALCVQLGWLPGGSWLGGLVAGGAVNVAAQASDLLESWVKRKAGVKDSGTWFGPSGGMLDLVDSFFLATPVALLAWPLLLRLGQP